ncbi:MAG TPA: nitrite reductase large subunit NirB [Amycolatopsis sp.]|uniref:nitrite reductase large subunit NirB n=1 Tax=Amycolatopsis sp. TaxID=37632 RepID=UPI002B45F49B|nr:nitrite reductase large subunit NirB [Amycolatopsis sp.]HKS46417.1 nitrite reductase large subunit NirB [Amycolatopsis sp.]
MSMRQQLVVVGNGMAGARVVEEILDRGGRDRLDITIFGDEPYGNYNRIMLSGLLAEEPSDDIFLNPVPWYAENEVTLRHGVRIVRVDRFAKRVYGDDGSIASYDKLVLATGSRTFFPKTEGMWVDNHTLTPGVFGFRTLDDTTAMIDYARRHRRAVVLGGGLLGLEAAHGLRKQGLDVQVVQSSPVLMNQQLDDEAGRILRRAVERLGISVRTGTRSSAILRGEDGSVAGIELGNETTACDMVVVTAGIRPNVGLAVVSGLTVERGIVVDDQLRSVDDDHIYAVGECVQHRGEVYGLVAPLWEQCTVLADHLTGTDPRAAYHGSRLATKLKVAGVDVAQMGLKHPAREDDEFVRFSEPRHGVYKSVVIRDGRLVGATLLGDSSKVAFLTQAYDRGLPLPEKRVELLFELAGPTQAESAKEMDDSVQVCNCNGVSKGDLVACVRGGTKSVSGVMTATRAGKGCGACKSLVADIVGLAAAGDLEQDESTRWYVPAIPMEKPELLAEIKARGLKSVSAVFAELARDGREDVKSKMPLASLLKMIWGPEYVDERDARFINDRVHANIQRDGTFSVVPRISGGVTDAAQLRRIADVADRYGVPMIKLTGGQRIDLLGVRKEDLPAVWADLGMPSGFAYGKSFRTVKTCVGTDFCRYGLGDSTALGIELEERYKGLESPAKMKLAVAGCPRNCSEAMVKDVGVVAVGDDRWEIYIGGAAGASVRKGDVLAIAGSSAEALRLCGTFMQYYRENANWLERTYDFVPRVGLDELKAVLVDDRDGVVAELDARMRESVDAFSDPWLEGGKPVTEGQFRDAFPVR